MGVFEDLFVKAKVAVDVIGEKAGQFVDTSKLNIKMAEMKSELKKEFESLGKTVYNANKNNTESKFEVDIQIRQIDSLHVQIEKLKNEIAAMKNKTLCKACGNQNEKDSSFCAKCGGELEQSSEEIKTVEEDDFAEFDD